MVSFTQIVLIGLLIFFEGLVYAFFSDLVDYFVPLFYNGALSSYNTDESIWGFNVLMTLFKYSIMIFLLYIFAKTWQLSQKPETSQSWP